MDAPALSGGIIFCSLTHICQKTYVLAFVEFLVLTQWLIFTSLMFLFPLFKTASECNWSEIHKRLKQTLLNLIQTDLGPDHILWHILQQ